MDPCIRITYAHSSHKILYRFGGSFFSKGPLTKPLRPEIEKLASLLLRVSGPGVWWGEAHRSRSHEVAH